LQGQESPHSLPLVPIALEGRPNRIQHVLVAERLSKEIYGARFHRTDRHRNVAMRRYEYDRCADAKAN
jgi:hypothetical protein